MTYQRLFAQGLACALIYLLTACGNGDEAAKPAVQTANSSLTLEFEGARQVDAATLSAMAAQADVLQYIDSANSTAGSASAPIAAVTLVGDGGLATSTGAVNETPLPHSTQVPVPLAERLLVKAYLNAPSDSVLTSFLALTSLNKSLLNRFSQAGPGERFKYTLLAQYYLNRAKDLGRREAWIPALISAAQAEIDAVVSRGAAVTSEENHPAHRYFNETFNYKEGNRYTALARLLDDFVEQPKNVYTAFQLTAVNTWIGGEAEFDDPTVLYNFVVGSYLSIHTMGLAQQLEVAWVANNNATPRFRMATILGGFSALNRRWLAKLHGDSVAVQAVDDEHRQWRLVQRAFHAFTVGLSFFEEQEHFAEGIAAWQDSFTHCAEVPVRTCSNVPRFSHNFASFVLGYVDFLLKAGQADAARQYLSIRHVPEQFPPMAAYQTWDLGRAGWEYRETHVDQIVAAYANGNQADDPMNFMMRKKRWGSDTATCQVCHQAQSTVWTEEEKNVILLPPEAVASVGVWPRVATTWYGSRLPPGP